MRLSVLALSAALLVAVPALAADSPKPDWTKCAAEIEKFSCKEAKDDKAIYECLIKHDDQISKKCDPETEKMEDASGKPK